MQKTQQYYISSEYPNQDGEFQLFQIYNTDHRQINKKEQTAPIQELGIVISVDNETFKVIKHGDFQQAHVYVSNLLRFVDANMKLAMEEENTDAIQRYTYINDNTRIYHVIRFDKRNVEIINSILNQSAPIELSLIEQLL